ncbi:MAG: hypothetical protein MJ229_01035 [bacterium]|nr:hypothetical protein [bacterium]
MKNKLLISALLLGALSTPAFAENGTLYRVKETSKTIINTIEFPVKLTTEEPSGEHVTIKIDGVTYYSTSPYPSNVNLKDLQNLINTGSVALIETDSSSAVFIIEPSTKAYSYDSSKLPTSAYKITNGTSSNYNFAKTDGTTTNYYKIDPTTNKTRYTINTTSGDSVGSFVIKNLGTNSNDTYYAHLTSDTRDSQAQITELSSKTEDIGTVDSPVLFKELSPALVQTVGRLRIQVHTTTIFMLIL